MKTSGSQLFFKFGLSARGAHREGGIGHFLKYVLGKPAGHTFVSVNGHKDVALTVNSKAFDYRMSLKQTQPKDELHNNQASCKANNGINKTLKQLIGTFLLP